jgi:hypothetical protein
VLSTVLAAEGFKNGTGGVGQHEVEIFPKQTHVDAGAGKVGNLIALPFGRKSQPLDHDLQPIPIALVWHASVPIRKHEEPPPHKGVPSDIDLKALRSALNYLAARARDYACWIRYGLALKTSLGDAGFDIWHEWSMTAENYKSAEDLQSKWKTFLPLPEDDEDAITVATIFYEAKQAGWDGGRTSTGRGSESSPASCPAWLTRPRPPCWPLASSSTSRTSASSASSGIAASQRAMG